MYVGSNPIFLTERNLDMPSTDIRDKSNEQHNLTEKRVPLPLAIFIILVICIVLGLSAWAMLSWI